MKIPFDPALGRLLGVPTRLVRSGRLLEATAAIQRALNPSAGKRASMPGDPPDASAEPKVIEGQFSRVADADAAMHPGRPLSGAAGDGADNFRAGAFSAGRFTAPTGTREYKLFVPEGYVGHALPLIVMLHGCTQNPDDFAAGTRMNVLAQEFGALVLYPAQASRANKSNCWNWFLPGDQLRGSGEPALLAALTGHIGSRTAVDTDRVYIAGLSAGGAMAAIMGREYPDLYAAVGVHSGLPAGSAHDAASAFAVMKSGAASPRIRQVQRPSGGAPVIVFHGDCDRTVHPGNSDRIIDEVAVVAARRGGVGASGRSYTCSTYGAADGSICAEHWLVHGAGHAWSGGSREGSYADEAGPDASREMVRFFFERRLRRAA